MDIKNIWILWVMILYFITTWWDLYDIQKGIDELKREISELKRKEND